MNLWIVENEFDKQLLKLIVIDFSYVKGIVFGVILEQNFVGGFKVKLGRIVYLIVNVDSVFKVVIFDVMDNSFFCQVEVKLCVLGFKIIEFEYISGEKDWVYSIKY